jgi:hypothetical protein
MKETVLYFKQQQKPGIDHYHRLYPDRQPPAVETINFLNPQPVIDFTEFDMSDPGSRIEYNAIIENSTPSNAAEYEQAYRKATGEDFSLYINGRKLGRGR